MQRPSITQLPPRRVTLADLRNIRETKKIALFHTRLLPTSKQIFVPNISSKSLNSKLLQLYPNTPLLVESERGHTIYDLHYEGNQMGMTQSLSIRKSKLQKNNSFTPQKPGHKSTRTLLSTINIKNYAPLFKNF